MAKKKNEKQLPIDQLEKIHAGANRLAGLQRAAQVLQAEIQAEHQAITTILGFADIPIGSQFEIDFKAGKVRW